jgi:hypothetical protein
MDFFHFRLPSPGCFGIKSDAMSAAPFQPLAYARALLVLGRVSNLPTVWSNCLAGWLLGGSGDWNLFFVLATGATCLYLGGVYLNDACDADFDRQYRRERPIPAGLISEWKVWCLSFMLLGGGLFLLALLGAVVFKLAVVLLTTIVTYDVFHKRFQLAPVLMGLCRGLLVVLSAAAASYGADGLGLWCATALGCYVAGLSYLAQVESRPGPVRYWPSALLFSPIALCLIVNDGNYSRQALVISGVLFVWLLGSIINAYRSARRVPEAVAKLLAGIVLVDLAAVGPIYPEYVVLFPMLFILALVLQRFVPAT